VSATVESELRGKTQLFPITHDPAYFPQSASPDSRDPRDREFLAAFNALPSDRGTGLPPIDRVFGVLPTLHYSDILIPGLAGDLERVAVADRLGLLHRTHPFLTFLIALVLLLVFGMCGAWWLLCRQRHKNAAAT
jgi:hypothetical protein